eukprot:6180406-Pleurochrysis_carterae.AAC.1
MNAQMMVLKSRPTQIKVKCEKVMESSQDTKYTTNRLTAGSRQSTTWTSRWPRRSHGGLPGGDRPPRHRPIHCSSSQQL